MKVNSALLLSLIAAVACTKKEIPSLMGKWEDPTPSSFSLERKVAQSNTRQCMKDVFTVETLKNEIALIEKQYARAQKIEGTWRNLDISRFPFPQAVYLGRYGATIGDQSQNDNTDFSHCTSVPCIINKVYGKEDSVAGYVHYLWFLKFGYVLAADNTFDEDQKATVILPGYYNRVRYPLSSYLFNEKELFGFWRLSHMLKAPYTNIRMMKQIRMAPRGVTKFATDRNTDPACGLADTRGTIFLTEGCLNFQDNPEKGWFYQKLVHEMAHQIDFEQGKLGKDGYRSEQADYLRIAGFGPRTEFVKNGILERTYQKLPGFKAVSDYAGRNPIENFAESMAYHRTDGDEAKEKMPSNTAQFISKNYYSDEAYHKEALMSQWVESEYASEVTAFALKTVNDCLAKPEGRSTYFKGSDFSRKIDGPVMSCLGKSAQDLAELTRAKILISEPEGCQTLNEAANRPIWDRIVKKSLAKMMEDLVFMDPATLAQYEQHFPTLLSSKLGKAAFLTCYQNRDENGCYHSELQRSLPGQLSNMYAGKYPFEKLKQESLQFYKNFIASSAGNVAELAEQTWNTCLKAGIISNEVPQGTYFVASGGYLHPSMHNCLNREVPNTIKNIIQEIVAIGNLRHPQEISIVTAEVRPLMMDFLQGKYNAGKANEKRWVTEYFSTKVGETRANLLKDLSWATNIISKDALVADCTKTVMDKLPWAIIYHVKNEIIQPSYGFRICENIDQSKELQAILMSPSPATRQKILASFEDSVLRELRSVARECVKQFPTDSYRNQVVYKFKRDACLNEKLYDAEYSAMTEGMKHPAVLMAGIDQQSVQLHLGRARQTIVTNVRFEFRFDP